MLESGDIALVGFGEAGQAFLSGWGLGGSGRVRVYDIKTDDARTAGAMHARYAAAGAVATTSLAAALDGVSLALCVVTADRAREAAEAAAPVIRAGTLWLDCNSCAPNTKRAAARAIDGAGGRYVDVAVMAPVHPSKHRAPLLVSGAAAEDAAALLLALDMRPTVAGPNVGDASMIKMLRSVMIKGIEAVTAECVIAARKAGVAEAVLASLQGSNPNQAWEREAAYNLERMMVHGVRRAAEMREVAATLAALGLPSRMSEACAMWQDELAALGLPGGADVFADRADRILAALDGDAAAAAAAA